MIAVIDHPDGSILPVRAQPGARRNAILGEWDGALRVAVSSPPDKGKANAAIGRFLAESLDCKASQVTLISGQTSRQKRFLLSGIGPEELLIRLDKLLALRSPKGVLCTPIATASACTARPTNPESH